MNLFTPWNERVLALSVIYRHFVRAVTSIPPPNFVICLPVDEPHFNTRRDDTKMHDADKDDDDDSDDNQTLQLTLQKRTAINRSYKDFWH